MMRVPKTRKNLVRQTNCEQDTTASLYPRVAEGQLDFLL